MTDTRTTEALVAVVRVVCEAIDEGGSIPSLLCTTYTSALDTLISRLEALEAEHEAVAEWQQWRGLNTSQDAYDDMIAAHNHAERVRQG